MLPSSLSPEVTTSWRLNLENIEAGKDLLPKIWSFCSIFRSTLDNFGSLLNRLEFVETVKHVNLFFKLLLENLMIISRYDPAQSSMMFFEVSSQCRRFFCYMVKELIFEML